MNHKYAESRYKKWIENKIELDRAPYYLYSDVIWLLDIIEFYATMPLDENEIDHVEKMRENYGFKELAEKPVTVLEVMLSLAIRCEINIMQTPEFADRTAKWFWAMFHNLGLDKYRDRKLKEQNDYPGSYEEIEAIIFDFLDRNYDHDGHGNIFTVENCRYNMREKSLWMQLNIWLSVNYHEWEAIEVC